MRRAGLCPGAQEGLPACEGGGCPDEEGLPACRGAVPQAEVAQKSWGSPGVWGGGHLGCVSGRLLPSPSLDPH